MAGLANALYGCEAAQCSDAAERKVQTAIAKAMGPTADRASNAMVFNNAADGADEDDDATSFIKYSLLFEEHIGLRAITK